MSFEYEPIGLDQALGEYSTKVHTSHMLFWTKDFKGNDKVIYCLMQMRSDGRLGFPGGKSDKKTVNAEEILSSLCRELQEEIAFIAGRDQITLEDRVSSHLSIDGRILHFFAKELPLLEFETIERNHMNATDFLKESLGLIRVPLRAVDKTSYKPLRKMVRNLGKHKFHGNARNQFIETVKKLDLIGKDDIKYFVKKMSV